MNEVERFEQMLENFIILPEKEKRYIEGYTQAFVEIVITNRTSNEVKTA